MRKNKLFALLAVAALSVSMVGCGSGSTGSTGSSGSSGSTASTSGGANSTKPLVWFNRQPSNSSTGELDMTALNFNDSTYYVGFDANQGAELQGQMVMDYIKANAATIDRNGDGVIGYVLAIGDIGHNDSIARTRGVRDALGTGVEASGSTDASPAGTNTDGSASVVKDATVDIDGKSYTIRELASQEMKNSAGATWDAAIADAEIGQRRGAVAQDDDVLRLDVLMDDAARMRVNERARDLLCKEDALLPRQAALLLQIFLEGHALDEFHYDIVRAVLVSDVIDRNDVVMAELCNSTGLDGKTLADVGVLGERLLEDLDRHVSSEYGIARAVDHRHAAYADHIDQLIAAAEQPADILVVIHERSRLLFRAAGKQRDRNIIAAAALKREGQQLPALILERACACKHLGDLLVLDHAGQAIRAQQENVAVEERMLEQVALHRRIHADRPGDEVLLRMRARVGFADAAEPAHFLYIGMILGDLAQRSAAHDVRAAVADVHDARVPALHEGADERRAHAAELGLTAGKAEHGVVRPVERAPQRFVAQCLVRTGLEHRLCLLDKALRRKAARDVACVCAAHSVAHENERAVPVGARFHSVNILIGRAHAPLIGNSEVFHCLLPPQTQVILALSARAGEADRRPRRYPGRAFGARSR